MSQMKFWKKGLALGLCGALLVSTAACGGKKKSDDDIEVTESTKETTTEPETTEEVVSDLSAEISWWTYPIFVQDEGQEDGTYEQSLIDRFNKKYPNIKVNLKVLSYTNGPEQLQAAIDAEGGELPNVLLD